MIHRINSRNVANIRPFVKRRILLHLKVGCRFWLVLTGLLITFTADPNCDAQFDIEEAPFEYSKTPDQNAVTDLIERLGFGESQMEHSDDFGYLPALLKEFGISTYSQGLVFSKTSLQVGHISSQNPRAIYFNDDVYIGWVRGSSLVEISTSDAKLGAAFYSAERSGSRLNIRRRNYTCLACHTTSMTKGVPGHTVRSVFPKHNGGFDYRRKSFITDHKSPIAERWGGWYVTGDHGNMNHMGNAVLAGNRLDTRHSSNLSDLSDRLFTLDWLTPYSDIVALMVLEHQTQMHNTLTVGNFTVRQAVYENQQRDGPSSKARGSAFAQIVDGAAKNIVDYMLFLNESPLTSEIKPSNRFAKVFSGRQPADSKGRSLRAFNLKSRLFEYPCSYMIYSHAFATLEPELRSHIYRRLWSTLNADESSDEFKHLNNDARVAIREIISDTKTDLPAYWYAHPKSSVSR
jgi:hypothetical protein